MSPNKFVATVDRLQQLKPWEVPVNSDVENHITTLYNTIHGEGGEAFYQRESRYIYRMIIEDKNKWNVTSLSVFLAFVDLAVRDLTLEPGAQALCYLLNRSSKMTVSDGNGGLKDIWENRAHISITGYGEILLRQRAGQIRHCDTPTVVYQGDTFSYNESDGRKNVSYSLNLAHDSGNPVACFMKITRLDGSVDYAIILPEAWRRLENYSLEQNKRGRRDKENAKANDLYSSGANNSIDPGFLIAKCVKHAFKGYPKLPVGKGTVMQADAPEPEQNGECYNMYTPEGSEKAKDPDSFATVADLSDGITVDPAADHAGSNDGTW